MQSIIAPHTDKLSDGYKCSANLYYGRCGFFSGRARGGGGGGRTGAAAEVIAHPKQWQLLAKRRSVPPWELQRLRH